MIVPRQALTQITGGHIGDGRMYLSATRTTLEEFEKVYGASGVLPALDGADHFRFRKSMSAAYSRTKVGRTSGRVSYSFMLGNYIVRIGAVGDSAMPAVQMCRTDDQRAKSLQSSISVDYSQDLIDDLASNTKTRALLTTHVVKIMPKFMLNTPGMKRRARSSINEFAGNRVQSGPHTGPDALDSPREPS